MKTVDLATRPYDHTVHESAGLDGDGYDLLLEAVNNFSPETISTGPEVSETGRFIMSCLSERQTELFEMVKSGRLPERESSDERLWTKMRGSILKHPSIISRLVELSEKEEKDCGEGFRHLIEDMDDQDWKNEAACKGDTRFVRQGFRSPEIKREIIETCANCPVLRQCKSYVKENKPELAVWAGKSAAERKEEGKKKK